MTDEIDYLLLLFLILAVLGNELLLRHLLWNSFLCFTSFQRSRCSVLLSSIRICNTDISNWKFVDMTHKYLNNAWLLSGFKVGVSNSPISIVHLNSLTIAATLRITSVSLIRSLLNAYWDVIVLWINTSWLPQSCPVIALVFFSNRCYFSTLFPLWLPHSKGHNVILSNLHISSKAPLNRLSVSTTTTATIPKYNTAYSINNLASDYALVSVVMNNIINFVKSHILFIRWHTSWFLCSAVLGDHMSRRIL